MSRWIGYALSISFIVTWWAIAFFPRHQESDRHSLSDHRSYPDQLSLPGLSVIHRTDLASALCGDLGAIYRLLLQWDMDAKLMQYQKVRCVKRLPKERLLTACKIAQQLLQSPQSEIDALRSSYRAAWVEDASAKPLKLDREFKSYLPQTFASASILLALLGDEGVAALPKGYLPWEGLAHKAVKAHSKVSNSSIENLSRIRPEIAFIAGYTNPATKQALKLQGIELFITDNPTTPDDVCETILKLGHIVNRAPEAFILAAFVEGAMIHFDNCSNLLKTYNSELDKPLFLYFFGHWYYPTEKNPTFGLLARLGWDKASAQLFDSPNSRHFLHLLTQEKILAFKPTHQIIASFSDNPPSCVQPLKNSNVFIIDANTQQSVSQFIVLAYFDLLYSFYKLSPSCNAQF